MMTAMDIQLIVLAGGKSSRMGASKAELLIHSEPILSNLQRRFALVSSSSMVLAAGQTLPRGSESFTTIVRDEQEGQGPLAGVVAGLKCFVAAVNVVVPVDMPGVTMEHAALLIDAKRSAMFRRETGMLEPMPMVILQADVAPVIDAHAAGERSLMGLERRGIVTAIDAPPDWPASVWANVNTLEDAASWGISAGQTPAR
jgi:molybdopterin-guanine dinucleotide biosynthesis protein A